MQEIRSRLADEGGNHGEETIMASRPLTFGVRFREKGRSVQVRAHQRDPKRYVVEVRRPGQETRRHDHPSLSGALRGFAAAWRSRLN